jgi:hemerythrin-like metal-binding protein
MLPQDLVTGNDIIDAQHQTILQCVEALRLTKDVHEYLTTLRNHFSAHFAEEERLAEQVSFPQIYTHRYDHMRFFDTFTLMAARYLRSPIPENREELINELIGWVKHHVLTEDIKLVAWIKEHPNAGPRR